MGLRVLSFLVVAEKKGCVVVSGVRGSPHRSIT